MPNRKFIQPPIFYSKSLFLIISIPFLWTMIIISNAEGHKLIDTPNDANTNYESALTIPNHTVSWAIYQQLGLKNEDARFYKFVNDKINSSLYTHITIPKIEEYKDFTPSLSLIKQAENNNDNTSGKHIIDTTKNNLVFDIPNGYELLLKSSYQGPLPSPVFYEPFTQTSYWERQEIRTQLHSTGTYYIVVFNENNNGSMTNEGGKFSLAVGEVEDFSIIDFFTLIPYSWIKLKFFFEDYISISIALIIFVLLGF